MADSPAAKMNYVTVMLVCAVAATVAFCKTEHDLRLMWTIFVRANKSI